SDSLQIHFRFTSDSFQILRFISDSIHIFTSDSIYFSRNPYTH
ncbi:hypothetical protein ACN38_g434, partial [Penicillium nordicum]